MSGVVARCDGSCGRRLGAAKSRGGFTLFEVLLAVALAAVLSGGIYAFLVTLQLRQGQILSLSERMRGGSRLIERLEGDVLASVTGTPGRGAGIDGEHDRVRILTRGVTPPLAGGVRTPLGDLQGVEMTFDGAAGVVRARRFDALGGTPAGEAEVIAEGLERVRFRYHDGRAWRGSFQSLQAGGLPAAVEVAIWFGQGAPAAGRERDDEAGAGGMGGVERAEGRAPREPMWIEEEAGPGEEEPPRRAPDRVRVIVVPDGAKAGGEAL